MMKNRIVLILLCLLILIFSIAFKEWICFKKANKFKKENKLLWAVDYYSYTIIWYLPFSPFVKIAENEIWEISENFEKKGELYKALFGYELLRSSLFQIKSFYQPDKTLIKRLNLKILEIKSKIENKKNFDVLIESSSQNLYFTVLAIFLFFLWMGIIGFTIFYGKTVRKVIFLSLTGFFIFLLWLVLLYYE